MQYRILGKTNINVSILGFGTMRLPIYKHSTNFEAAIRLIHFAIDQGINFFDIGSFYCHFQCEKVFGTAINKISSGRIIISGKNATHQTDDHNWLGQLYNSLLFVNHPFFDIYFIHNLSLKKWRQHFILQKVIDQIEHAKRQKLIRHLGFSSHDDPMCVKALIDTDLFDAVILPYNLLQRNYEEMLRYAFEKNMGVLVMNPLAGGALISRNSKSIFQEYSIATNTALNFVLSQPFIHCVLSGMETDSIILENCATANQERLTQRQIMDIKQSIKQIENNHHIPCTQCGYCLPCPQGIDIPAILKTLDGLVELGHGRFYNPQYASLPVRADCCIACKSCQQKCPQKIDISRKMKQAMECFYH